MKMSNPEEILDMQAVKLVEFCNTVLAFNLTHLEELCTGGHFCQMLEILAPGLIDLKKVEYVCNRLSACRRNYALLQAGLDKLSNRPVKVPIEELVHGDLPTLVSFTSLIVKFVLFNMKNGEHSYDIIRERFQRDSFQIGKPHTEEKITQTNEVDELSKLIVVNKELDEEVIKSDEADEIVMVAGDEELIKEKLSDIDVTPLIGEVDKDD